MPRFWLVSTLALLSLWTATDSAKVLLLVINHSSHVIYFGHLAKSLAAEGHQVTAVTGAGMKIYPEFKESKNINWETYRMTTEPITHSDEQVEAILSAYMGNVSMIESLGIMTTFFQGITEEVKQIYDDAELFAQLEKSEFDFAVIDASVLAYLYVPYRLNIPFATLSIDVDPMNMRIPFYPSWNPPLMAGYPERMNFYQRTVSFVSYYGFAPVLRLLVGSDTGLQDAARCVPGKEPKLYMDLLRTASLFFTLRTPLLQPIRASIPNIHDIGGIMMRPVNLSTIPREMNDFVSKSSKGFIIVSFGSWLDKLPDEIIEKFVQAFSSVEVNILWKISEDRVPAEAKELKTIMFTKWMPQNDLLGHPNIKGFVTHCGISSIIETLYNGVPIVAFPMGLDQSPNAKLMQNRHFGIILDIAKFTPDDLVAAINNITAAGNEFKESIDKTSAILRDVPEAMHAGKTASVWISHVIKHGDAHLRSAAYDLSTLQYLSVDVMAFLLAMSVLFMIMTYFCCSKVCCRCFRSGCCAACCKKCCSSCRRQQKDKDE